LVRGRWKQATNTSVRIRREMVSLLGRFMMEKGQGALVP
jgi:hypothetical protein